MSATKELLPVSRNSAGNLFLLDTDGFHHVVVQLFGTFAGTVTWEVSNDNVNWFSTTAFTPTNIGNGQPTSTTTTTGIYVVNTLARFMRARISTYTSGTFQAVGHLSEEMAPQLAVVAQLTASSLTVPTTAQGSTTFVKSGAAAILANLKTTAGNLVGAYLRNNSAADKWVRFYNKASAPIVSDTPVFVVKIPAGGELRFDHELAIPRFSTGIAYGISGGAADNDATALAVNDVSGFLVWA